MSSSLKSGLIDGDAVICDRWEAPSIEKQNAKQKSEQDIEQQAIEHQRMLTAEEIEKLQERAREEGFQKGLQDGASEIQQRVAHLEAVLNKLDEPLQNLDDEVVEQMVSLSTSIARQLVRRELKIEPEQVVAVVRETISSLPVTTRDIRVFLNPEDAKIVREVLLSSSSGQRWEIIEEPVMSRGGCKVVTDTSRIDASMESRFTAIAANLLGGERKTDDEHSTD